MKVVFFYLLFSSLLLADPITQPHITVELMTSKAKAEKGTPLDVGVRLEPEKGWHLYWVNPGDAGKAPTVQFVLPAGFSAGPLRWPTPSRLPQGRLVGFGYEHAVILGSEVQIPKEAPKSVDFQAMVEWLVCNEACVPGKLTLHTPQEIGDTNVPSKEAILFTQGKAIWPQPLGSTIDAVIQGNRLVFSLIGVTAQIGATFFFPYQPRIISNAAPQVLRTTAEGSVELAIERADTADDKTREFQGVLVSGEKSLNVGVKVINPSGGQIPWFWGLGAIFFGGLVFLVLKGHKRS